MGRISGGIYEPIYHKEFFHTTFWVYFRQSICKVTNYLLKLHLSVSNHTNFCTSVLFGKTVSQYACVFLTLYPMAVKKSMLTVTLTYLLKNSAWTNPGNTVPKPPVSILDRKTALAGEGQVEMDSSKVRKEIVENFMFFSLATEISFMLAKVGKSLPNGC